MNIRRRVAERQTLETMELEFRRAAVMEALRLENNHCGRAAARLGIHRNTVTHIVAAAKIPPKPERRVMFRQRRTVTA